MNSVLPQELSSEHGAWLRSTPVSRCLIGPAVSFGTASTWSNSFGPSAGITSLATACATARSKSALIGNTGWSPEQYRTLILFYPAGRLSWWEHDSDVPLLVNYDPALSVVGRGPSSTAGFVGPAETLRPQIALTEISTWTGLSTSRLGELLGVARRSIYNWMEGRTISRDMQRRVEQVHAALSQVEGTRGRESTRAWLDEGDPSNFELLRGQQWEVIDEHLSELGPKRAVRVDEAIPPPEPDEQELEVERVRRDAVLSLFVASRPAEPKPRPVWVPRELTGATPFDEDDESES